MNVWAFSKAAFGANKGAIKLVYESCKSGKSRFGWSTGDESNLSKEENYKENSKQCFLLQIKPGDWIVHINTPSWGKCIAAKVKSSYGFDEGLKCECPDRIDFRHKFELDTDSIIEFERNDPNVLPTVNLKPRKRYHEVRCADDFRTSIENLRA